ncbi:Abhydrolase domain-containing protein C22H12.03 [Hypsizygus marmoreus]|uniref:Abhydrolase domain-containing protein C22H12.03 n=1 Tax=Hypsizygus marmoreus TaxID=39966 RepID=A0A369K1L5_HYPMA|nr:Abhydrolase domain-containing protein C22H12.03 [Hypsizygus marmoreus]
MSNLFFSRTIPSTRSRILWNCCTARPTSIIQSSNLSHHAPRHAHDDGAVHLDYALHTPPDGNKHERALVILHGLLGSKRNFTSLAKGFTKDLGIPVYTLDLRNQGTSPHVKPMTYSAMASDVLHFIHTHSLSNITLLGHSMGGKVAMSVALHPSLSEPANKHLLSKLIVADVAPTRMQLSPEFKGYVEAMQKIEGLNLTSRKEALDVLEPYESDPAVRAFLLTNLKSMTEHEPYARFRVPLDILVNAMPEIGSFPYVPGERSWMGPTMFIKGLQSAYINRHSLASMEAFFPNMEMETLDAGHWVHGERPREFKKLVEDFIRHGSA